MQRSWGRTGLGVWEEHRGALSVWSRVRPLCLQALLDPAPAPRRD